MDNQIDFHFVHPLRVRWAESDPQGIVFNGHYLTYFDVAVTEYWRDIGITFPEGITQYGSDFFVKKSMLEYHSPAFFDDELQIYVSCVRIGNSSLQFAWEIKREATSIVSGETIYVNANEKTRQPERVPDALREKIERFEQRVTTD